MGRQMWATGVGAVGGLAIGALAGVALAGGDHGPLADARAHSHAVLVIDQSIPKMALGPDLVIWFGSE